MLSSVCRGLLVLYCCIEYCALSVGLLDTTHCPYASVTTARPPAASPIRHRDDTVGLDARCASPVLPRRDSHHPEPPAAAPHRMRLALQPSPSCSLGRPSDGGESPPTPPSYINPPCPPSNSFHIPTCPRKPNLPSSTPRVLYLEHPAPKSKTSAPKSPAPIAASLAGILALIPPQTSEPDGSGIINSR